MKNNAVTANLILARPLVGVQSAHAALATAALLWSGNFLVGRALNEAFTPIGLNFWRWTIAALVLVPLAWSRTRSHAHVLRREWRLVALLGLTGVAAFHTCVYAALEYTTALKALLLLSLSPITILLGSRLAHDETLNAYGVLGTLVSLAGVLILISEAQLSRLVTLEFNRGDLWMLLAVVFWTVYSLALKCRPNDLPQITLLSASTIVGLVPLTVAALFTGAWVVPLTPTTIGGIIYVALCASVIAFSLWNCGVVRLGPGRAGIFMHMMPVFGAVLAFVFLGEAVETYHALGAGLVGAGIVLTSRRQK